MANKGAIDLLPEIPEEEVQKVEKRGKLNVFSVFSIFSILFMAIFILLGNLYAQIEYNITNQRLSDSRQKILDMQYIELKQNTLNTKMASYESVRSHDFSSDVILTYLLEVSGELSDVRGLHLDDSMTFTVSGTADSYLNVARIWHNMSEQEDYFEVVNLSSVGLTDTDDEESVVRYSFSGKMIKDNVDDL